MSTTYKMEDGTIVKTQKAMATWAEAKNPDGSSRNTGFQWSREQLYRSRNGRYYLEHASTEVGTALSRFSAEWISLERAAAWLDVNDHQIPDELLEAYKAITE